MFSAWPPSTPFARLSFAETAAKSLATSKAYELYSSTAKKPLQKLGTIATTLSLRLFSSLKMNSTRPYVWFGQARPCPPPEAVLSRPTSVLQTSSAQECWQR